MKTRIYLHVLILFLIVTFICHSSENAINEDSRSIDLVIKLENVSIGGTLIMPSNLKTNSLVIMSSGSGPQDRDETLEGFKIFKVIAEHLASKGIASFRYDDRGVGVSTGDFVNSTLDNHSKDLEGIMDYFKTKNKHSFKSFILFGHSQGGILAGKVAVENASVKKLILMAAPAVPLVEVVLYQVRQDYNQTNISNSLIEADVSAHNKLMWAIEDGKAIKEANQLFLQTTETILYEINSETKVDSSAIKEQAIAKAETYKMIYGLPSLTSYLYYDPASDLEKLSIPVLSLFGGLDYQVPIHQNKDVLENALLKSGAPYKFITFDKANHYFQEARTGKREEYAILEKNFVPDFLKKISDWILEYK
ncbi:alpha/beta hydrolase family protein [Mangrovivirga cuniculi]|uniref:Alpha/beta hydrolase n=1 Tax=Mangrovivirga cuniculi TaxID=2715131 RepID=A0A4D7JTV2_9BACT|nr:alpha/beta hydrolase [Mangrovivirga cuniculi]QCK15596.1 alpha/beta hydrolase [Mangrovivirga cuniculi]